MKILKLLNKYIWMISWPAAFLIGVYGSKTVFVVFVTSMLIYAGYRFSKT